MEKEERDQLRLMLKMWLLGISRTSSCSVLLRVGLVILRYLIPSQLSTLAKLAMLDYDAMDLLMEVRARIPIKAGY